MKHYIKAVAVQGKAQGLIDDEHTTSGTTYSSEKIESEIIKHINEHIIGDFVIRCYEVTFPTVTGNTYFRLDGITSANQFPMVLGASSVYKTGQYYSNQFDAELLFNNNNGGIDLRFANISQAKVDIFGGTKVWVFVAYKTL